MTEQDKQRHWDWVFDQMDVIKARELNNGKSDEEASKEARNFLGKFMKD